MTLIPISWACRNASAGVTPPTPLGALAFSKVISSPMVWRKRDPNESGTPSFGKNTSGLRGIDNRAHKFIKRRTAKVATAKEMMTHMLMSNIPRPANTKVRDVARVLLFPVPWIVGGNTSHE